jgi:predicted TIM-barrel fold metal-dependent hydrolase
MRIIDIDAHYQEPFDWLEKHDPKLAEELPGFNMAAYFADLVAGEFIAQIPVEVRPSTEDVLPDVFVDFIARIPKGNVKGAEVEAALDRMTPQDGGPVYKAFRSKGSWRADERVELLDQFGIDKQFINPSIALGWVDQASKQDKLLGLKVLRAYNEWAMDNVSGYEDRLLPVAHVNLENLEWAIAEIKRLHKRGCRAFQIPAVPVSGRSLGHPDFESIWALAEDLGMAVVFHVAHAGSTVLGEGWGNTGGDFMTSMMTYRSQQEQIPTLALTSMIFSGVFERHPKLVVMSQELGVDWLPYWLTKIDTICEANIFSRTCPYTLPLKPSEYAQRNLFVSGLATPSQCLQPTFDQVTPGILAFASDFPHPEGGELSSAWQTFSDQLQEYSEEVRNDFFGEGIARAMAL